MESFFTKKQTESKTRPDGKLYSCTACGLYKNCTNPRMKPFGNFKKKILNIGEAPGEMEDRNGKPWQGKAGKLLQRTYKNLGIDLFDDCLNINAVRCRPVENEENRAPSNFEIDCCRMAILQIIEEYKPKLVILLGNAAVFSVIGHRWKKDLSSISKWRGWTIPDQDFHTWLCPTFHPSFIERSTTTPGIIVEETIWVQDLKRAFQKLKETFPVYEEPEIEIVEDLSVLGAITSNEIAIDYETTGIKPQAPGHKIICCSIATNENHAYVFMLPQTNRERLPLIDLLANPKIGKIAQNMKYEDTWSLVRLRQRVVNWIWDTMLASHILDNRPGVTGLKFQVYVQFGIVDYSSEVDSFFSSDDNKNANSINKISTLLEKPGGKEKLMKYCGYDAIYELRLSKRQRGIIFEHILPF